MSAARQCVELDGTCRGNSLALERDGQVRCLTHATDPVRIRRREERNLRGGLGKLRTLPGDTKAPTFRTRLAIVKFMEQLAAQVLKGEVDAKLSAEARGCATVAMQAHELEALERLAALEKRLTGGRRIA